MLNQKNKQIMAKIFKLTKEQKEVLLGWGHKEREFNQIEDATNYGIIINLNTNRVLCWKTALKRLGEREFLSGISRASFHWTAHRNMGNERIRFDFSNYFK